MRLIRALQGDMRYQTRYGLYLVFLVTSVVYMGLVFLLPVNLRQAGVAIIVLSEPATVGLILAGAILLLEKGEGLHSYLSITPLRPREYILAKAISLAGVSTLAGLAIAAATLGEGVDYLLMGSALLVGSGFFTLVGLGIGAAARSINHFAAISVPTMLLLMTPALITAFGMAHPSLELIPSTLLWRVLHAAVGLPAGYSPLLAFVGLIIWLLAANWWANYRYLRIQQLEGGVLR